MAALYYPKTVRKIRIVFFTFTGLKIKRYALGHPATSYPHYLPPYLFIYHQTIFYVEQCNKPLSF